MFKTGSTTIRSAILLVNLLLIAAFVAPLCAYAQSGDAHVTVTAVNARTVSNGTAVLIAADGPLSQAQTWQDIEGYHVVVPAAAALGSLKAPSGVKVRQLGSSIEILVQTKAGSIVNMQSAANRLTLTVDGQLEPRSAPKYVDDPSKSAEQLALRQADLQRAEELRQSARLETRAQPTAGADAHNSGAAPQGAGTPAANSANGVTAQPTPAEDSVLADYGVWILVGGGLLLLLGALKLRSRRAAAGKNLTMMDDGFEPFEDAAPVNPKNNRRQVVEQPGALVKHTGPAGSGVAPQKKSLTLPVPMTNALFGAYRVDQEVGKLVVGQPHRMDVLGSRSLEDRRAIEASLLKAMTLPDATEEERRRARSALEEYGFVARQSAHLLLASDPYERSSAAKLLGDFKSPASLPFLLEALYDNELIVRNQAVLSIGELKLPSAIGALLDIARRHPDVSGSLLTRALSACSVEGLDFFDIPEPSQLTAHHEALTHEFTQLEPASAVEDLPETADDQRLMEAISKLESANITERAEAIKAAAQFVVQVSVTALGKVARLDEQASIRALAIAGLASINHESVFPAVLIGMADESREVRAAAARSLSRLSFDRADAYVRVMETHDSEALRDVAQACIKAGIVSQGIDRLASNDRRQVYEAFSIVSLLAKANMIEPILDAIAHHPNMDLRLTAIRLLGTTAQPEILEQLSLLSEHEDLPDFIRIALQETMPKANELQHEERQAPIESEVAAAGELHEPEIENSGLPAPGIA
jgi:HEAT repeat protein